MQNLDSHVDEDLLGSVQAYVYSYLIFCRVWLVVKDWISYREWEMIWKQY